MYYSLESFIDYCDNMMIAEESYKDLLSKKKLIETKVKALKIDLINDKIPYEKKCKMIDETVTELEQLKNEFSKIKATDLERNIDRVASVIKSAIGFCLLIPESILNKKGLGSDMFDDGFDRVYQFKNIDKFKKEVIDKVDFAISEFKEMKPYLKNMKVANEGLIQRMKDNHASNKIMKSHGHFGPGKQSRFDESAKKAETELRYSLYAAKDKDLIKNHKDAYEFMKFLSNDIKNNISKIIKKYKKTPHIKVVDDKRYFYIYFSYPEKSYNDEDDEIYDDIADNVLSNKDNITNKIKKYKISYSFDWDDEDKVMILSSGIK